MALKHNDFIFSNADGQFRFLRRFDEMYRNCEDPHGQSQELQRTDYHLVATLIERALAAVAGKGAKTVLDVGCGLGYFTSHIKRLFPQLHVAGCDISATAVEKARARAPECEFFVADLKNSPAHELYGDVLVALDVLYYFTDEEIGPVVRNLHGMVRDAGFLLVGYHLPERMSFGRYIRSLDDARTLFEANGFRFRFTLDVVNDLDTTYTGDAVGRHIYFLAQKAP